MNGIRITIFLIFCSYINAQSFKCPVIDYLNECKCYEQSERLICTGIPNVTITQLKKLVTFKLVIVQNGTENIKLTNIVTEVLTIENNANLTTIDLTDLNGGPTQSLVIKNNSAIDDQIFGQIKTLTITQTIRIEDCKNITKIPTESFKPIIGANLRLKTISLRHNSIETIEKDAFANVTNLEEIYLEHNLLSVIEPNAFNLEASHSIKAIYLSNNRVKVIEEKAFLYSTPNQVIIYLDSNQINNLDNISSTGNEKTKVYLTSNSFVCDCEMWKRYNETKVFSDVKCTNHNKDLSQLHDTLCPLVIPTTSIPVTSPTGSNTAITTQPPAATTQQPGATTGQPTVTTQPPVMTTGQPAVTTQPPVVTTGQPAVTTQPPVVTTGQPAVTTQPPVVTTGQPAVTTQPPIVTTGQTEVTSQPPVVTTGQPAVTTQPPVVTTGQLEVTSQPPVVTTGQPAVTTQPPVVTTGQPAVTTQPPVITTQSSEATTQPSEPGTQPIEPEPTDPNLLDLNPSK